MKPTEVAMILRTVRAAYPRFNVNDDVAQLWNSHLSQVSYEDGMNRLVLHIATKTYHPTIAHIVQDNPDTVRPVV